MREAKNVMRKAGKMYQKYDKCYCETHFHLAKRAKSNLETAAKFTYHKSQN